MEKFTSIQKVREFCASHRGHPATPALEEMLEDIAAFGAAWTVDDFNNEYHEQVARHDALLDMWAHSLCEERRHVPIEEGERGICRECGCGIVYERAQWRHERSNPGDWDHDAVFLDWEVERMWAHSLCEERRQER